MTPFGDRTTNEPDTEADVHRLASVVVKVSEEEVADDAAMRIIRNIAETLKT